MLFKQKKDEKVDRQDQKEEKLAQMYETLQKEREEGNSRQEFVLKAENGEEISNFRYIIEHNKGKDDGEEISAISQTRDEDERIGKESDENELIQMSNSLQKELKKINDDQEMEFSINCEEYCIKSSIIEYQVKEEVFKENEIIKNHPKKVQRNKEHVTIQTHSTRSLDNHLKKKDEPSPSPDNEVLELKEEKRQKDNENKNNQHISSEFKQNQIIQKKRMKQNKKELSMELRRNKIHVTDYEVETIIRNDYLIQFNSVMKNVENKGCPIPDKILNDYSRLAETCLKNCFVIQKTKKGYYQLEDCYEILKEIESLKYGKIGYEKVGRRGKDRHYVFIQNIEQNMIFKEVEGEIYAKWKKPLRKYTRGDAPGASELFFWLFDRVTLKDMDYNGKYKLARKIRETFKQEQHKGRDYFILKKDFSFVKKIVTAKYYELQRKNEINRFRNMSKKAFTNCLEAVEIAKKGKYTTGSLSIPSSSDFKVFFIDGKKLWTEVFNHFEHQYKNLYDVPKTTLWNKTKEIELKLIKPLILNRSEVSFSTNTLRDNFYVLEDGKTFVSKYKNNTAWYEPCQYNWMFKSTEYVFENPEIRKAMFIAGIIDSVSINGKKGVCITQNAPTTNIDKPIDGWTFSADNYNPYEILEIKKVGTRAGHCDDHIRDVIKTIGWTFQDNKGNIHRSMGFKINFYESKNLLSLGIDDKNNYMIIHHWNYLERVERLSEAVENALVIRQGSNPNRSTAIINRPLLKTISSGNLIRSLKRELKLVKGFKIKNQVQPNKEFIDNIEKICNQATSTPDIFYRILDYLIKSQR